MTMKYKPETELERIQRLTRPLGNNHWTRFETEAAALDHELAISEKPKPEDAIQNRLDGKAEWFRRAVEDDPEAYAYFIQKFNVEAIINAQ